MKARDKLGFAYFAASQRQKDWFVDFVNGSDENDGKTVMTAIKTVAELKRRLNGEVSTFFFSRHILFL